MKIGNDVMNKKASGMINPKDSEEFQKFKEQKSKRAKEAEPEKLTGKMPNEKEPSDDKVADEMTKLAEEKSAYSNKRQRTVEDIEPEENE